MEDKESYSPEEVYTMMQQYSGLESLACSSYNSIYKLEQKKEATDEEIMRVKDIGLQFILKLLDFERTIPRNISEKVVTRINEFKEKVESQINRRDYSNKK